MIKIATERQEDYCQVANIYLSRYACYLIVQNSDPSKKLWH